MAHSGVQAPNAPAGRKPGLELPLNGRRALLVVHVVLAALTCGGLAALLAMLSLRHSALPSAGDRAAFLLLDYLIVPASVGFVVTGAGFSLFTRWGFARYGWVVVKWAGTMALGAALIAALSPAVATLAALSETGLAFGDLPAYEAALGSALLWAWACLLCVVGLIALSVFKPGRARVPVQGTMTRGVQFAVSAAALTLVAAFAWQAAALAQLRRLPVAAALPSVAPDGRHEGTATMGGFEYRVAVTVRKGRLQGVDVLHNRNSGYARHAARVTHKIVAAQSACVDGVTGATTTSRAIQSATGDALSRALPGPRETVLCP